MTTASTSIAAATAHALDSASGAPVEGATHAGMAGDVATDGTRRGVLSGLAEYLRRRRVGDLLVARGLITPAQLEAALAAQAGSGRRLGQILVQQGAIRLGTLYRMLATQMALRTGAMAIGILLGVGATTTKTRAQSGWQEASLVAPDMPGQGNRDTGFPRLFNTVEIRTSSVTALSKWASVMARMQGELDGSDDAAGECTPGLFNSCEMQEWRAMLDGLGGQPLAAQIERVNAWVNRVRFVSDERNWSEADYWSSPDEFFTRGGDCEDYAIAKYISLRLLGVPDAAMRIVVARDTARNLGHAILVVNTSEGPLVLDNLERRVRPADAISRYRPLYSLNEGGWWLHRADTATPSRRTATAS